MVKLDEAYFDNSATTFVTPAVLQAMTQAMTATFGNPSSKHRVGLDAENMLRKAREDLADTLHAGEKEIFFTSGATESNNWAVIGGAMANRRAGNHLITTAVEHPSVLMPMQYLAQQGFRVTYLPVDQRGRISLADLEQALDEETILVSIMHVNNEVGAREPVEEAARLVKAYSPRILFHTDAVQSYGKYVIRPDRWGVDLLSVSAHKLHGPKGSGMLYIREKTKIQPFILGGGQQKGMRSGTDNVPGAVGLGTAAKESYAHFDENHRKLLELKTHFTEGLRALENVVIHSGDGEDGAPHIVSASFVGVRSEVMLHALEDKGIYVSAGSACSSNKKLPVSSVLQQMHLPRQEQESTLRFSFDEYNTIAQTDEALKAIAELLPVLRRYARY